MGTQRTTELMRCIRRLTISLTSAVILILCGVTIPSLPGIGQSHLSTFEQVWQTVNKNFYDPNFNGVNWGNIKAEYQPLANRAQSQTELAQIINQMLSELQTSHTHFYTPADPAYYQLLGAFLRFVPDLQQQLDSFLPDGKPQYSGIGIFTEERGDRTFVRGILDGSPADASGLLVGDQLLSVEGRPFHPINSFLGKAEQPVKLLVQRSPDSQTELTVTPQMLDGTEMFLDAMKASIEVIERGGKQIGYVHLWSYAGEQFHNQLKHELFLGQLKDVNSFILDLRDGWGGASASYLNIYTSHNLRITGTARNRPPSTSSSAWSKPVVMLVNGGSRSGKEVLAYGFRKHAIGPVVGSRTAGAVVNGNLYVMDDGTILYLAIADIYLDDNQRIEGVGVEPDVEVPFALEYAQGADPQKERAIEIALEGLY